MAEPSLVAEPQAPAHRRGSPYRRRSSWLWLSRMSQCWLCRSSPVRCPVVRCAGVRCAGCPVRRVSVSVRLASASASTLSARGGLWSASVRGGPTVWDGSISVWSRARVCERLVVCPSLAGLERRRLCWAFGGAGRDLAAVLGCAQTAAAATFDACRPGTAGWAQRVARRLAEGSRWGSGCARRSPTCWMAAQVVRSRIAGMRPDHNVGWTACGGHPAWSLWWPGPGRSALGRAGWVRLEQGARPHRGPGIQRARPARAGGALTCKNGGGRDRV
jgi:hypothetical protein